MYDNGTIKTKAEAEKEITAYADMRKRVAALCRNSDIHAAFRQFNGKVINKRFDEALKAASVKADGGNEETRRTLRIDRASKDYNGRTYFEVFGYGIGGYEAFKITRVGTEYDKTYQPRTGERLDAEAAIAELTAFADRMDAEAKCALDTLADYDAIAASAKAIHDAIKAHNNKWDYTALHKMEGYID